MNAYLRDAAVNGPHEYRIPVSAAPSGVAPRRTSPHVTARWLNVKSTGLVRSRGGVAHEWHDAESILRAPFDSVQTRERLVEAELDSETLVLTVPPRIGP